MRGVASSSTLHAMQHVNNFLLRDQLGDKWTMAVSEEGLKTKGFMTVIAAKDTRQGVVPHVCKMQVAFTPLYTTRPTDHMPLACALMHSDHCSLLVCATSSAAVCSSHCSLCV